MRAKLTIYSTTRGPNGGIVATFDLVPNDPDNKAFYATPSNARFQQTFSKLAVEELGIVVGKEFYLELVPVEDEVTLSGTSAPVPAPTPTAPAKPAAPQPLND